jgi:hypothetical protein
VVLHKKEKNHVIKIIFHNQRISFRGDVLLLSHYVTDGNMNKPEQKKRTENHYIVQSQNRKGNMSIYLKE